MWDMVLRVCVERNVLVTDIHVFSTCPSSLAVIQGYMTILDNTPCIGMKCAPSGLRHKSGCEFFMHVSVPYCSEPHSEMWGSQHDGTFGILGLCPPPTTCIGYSISKKNSPCTANFLLYNLTSHWQRMLGVKVTLRQTTDIRNALEKSNRWHLTTRALGSAV